LVNFPKILEKISFLGTSSPKPTPIKGKIIRPTAKEIFTDSIIISEANLEPKLPVASNLPQRETATQIPATYTANGQGQALNLHNGGMVNQYL